MKTNKTENKWSACLSAWSKQLHHRQHRREQHPPTRRELAFGGPVYTAEATQETQRSSPSNGARVEATAELQELLRWTPEYPNSNSGAVTIKHHCETMETTAAEESDSGTRQWTTQRLCGGRTSDGQPTEHRVCLRISCRCYANSWSVRLTADQWRKVSPWSQFFRCAGFKGSSTASELVKTAWLSFFLTEERCFVMDREAAIFTPASSRIWVAMDKVESNYEP